MDNKRLNKILTKSNCTTHKLQNISSICLKKNCEERTICFKCFVQNSKHLNHPFVTFVDLILELTNNSKQFKEKANMKASEIIQEYKNGLKTAKNLLDQIYSKINLFVTDSIDKINKMNDNITNLINLPNFIENNNFNSYKIKEVLDYSANNCQYNLKGENFIEVNPENFISMVMNNSINLINERKNIDFKVLNNFNDILKEINEKELNIGKINSEILNKYNFIEKERNSKIDEEIFNNNMNNRIEEKSNNFEQENEKIIENSLSKSKKMSEEIFDNDSDDIIKVASAENRATIDEVINKYMQDKKDVNKTSEEDSKWSKSDSSSNSEEEEKKREIEISEDVRKKKSLIFIKIINFYKKKYKK